MNAIDKNLTASTAKQSNGSIELIARNIVQSIRGQERNLRGTTIALHLRLALYELYHHHKNRLPYDLVKEMRVEIGM